MGAPSSPALLRPGDFLRGWHFDVTLHNLSGAEASYELELGKALSEIVEVGYRPPADWRGGGTSPTWCGRERHRIITVPANGDRGAWTSSLGKPIPRCLRRTEHPPTQFSSTASCASPRRPRPSLILTVPYLGFYGNWGKAIIFDARSPRGWRPHALASPGSTTAPLASS